MKNNLPWYQDGLKFKCTGCGQCCTGSPGYVWVNEEEMEKIAAFLKIDQNQFRIRFTKKVGHRYSLVEFKKNYDCVFLKDGKCSVYPVRPTQCQTFPFWPQNLASSNAWEETAKKCEGISENAPHIGCKKIEEQKLVQLNRNGDMNEQNRDRN